MESSNKKWIIIGYRREFDYGCYDHCSCEYEMIEEKVATFDSKKMAEDYVKKSKLKSLGSGRIFRAKSLLSIFNYVEVEEYDPESFPHNPTI